MGEFVPKLHDKSKIVIKKSKLKGYTAQELLTDEDKLVESLMEVHKLYTPDGMPIMFDLQVEAEILDSARMMRLSQPVMLFRVILPYIIPGILTGLKVTMTTSVLMLNFAELMGATHGMGYYIQNSIVYANYTRAVAGIIVIGM